MSSRLSLVLLILCSSLWGCELIADFDRGKLTPAVQRSDAGNTNTDEDAGQDAAVPEKGAD